jgi:hypothetical protein
MWDVTMWEFAWDVRHHVGRVIPTGGWKGGGHRGFGVRYANDDQLPPPPPHGMPVG